MEGGEKCRSSLPMATYKGRSLYVRFVNMAAMLPFFLLVVCSGEGAEEREECPLVTNGRLSECNAMAEKVSHYTDQQLYHACKEAELQAWPQCLKRIIEECQNLGHGDPGQLLQLHNATLLWKAKFDHICATVVELHQSKGTASFVSTSSSQWHVATWLPSLALVLLLLCLPRV